MKYAAFAALLMLSGCVTSSGDFCDIARPLRLTETTVEAMTESEARAALAHNEKGASLCGWKQ